MKEFHFFSPIRTIMFKVCGWTSAPPRTYLIVAVQCRVSVSSGCNCMGPSNGLLITQSAAATLSDRRYTDTYGEEVDWTVASDRGL